MHRVAISDPPQTPYKLSKHNLTGGTEPVWTADLPHVQVGAPVEHDDKVYVPLAKVVSSPVTANKTLCWVEIEPSLVGDPEVGTPVDVPYQPAPFISGTVIGGSVDDLPTGGRLGHIHPSCFLGLHSGTVAEESRRGGFYCSMLSTVIGGVLYAIPYMFASAELLVFKPVAGEAEWRLQGWDEEDLWREIYAPLLITGRLLLVHYERWEYEEVLQTVFDDSGLGSIIDNFLLKQYPEDNNADNIGDAYSADGFGWGDLRWWIEGSDDLTQDQVLHYPVPMGDLEAIALRVGAHIESLLAAQTTATAKIPVSRRHGFREYDVVSGVKQNEVAIPDRGACILNAHNVAVKHRHAYWAEWRLETIYTSAGLAAWSDLTGYDIDIDEPVCWVAVSYGNNGSNAGDSSLAGIRTGFIGPPPYEAFDNTNREAIVFLVVRRKTWVTCETSKRLPYRTYDVASDATRYVWSPGLQRAHEQTITTDNPERDREEGGGGGGGGGGGFG